MQLKPSTHNISIHFPHKLSHSLITFSLGGISAVTEIRKMATEDQKFNAGETQGQAEVIIIFISVV